MATLEVTDTSKKRARTACYKSFYKQKWAKIYPVTASRDSNHAFYCIPCKKTVSCSHQGIGDVKRHCATNVHRHNMTVRGMAAPTHNDAVTMSKVSPQNANADLLVHANMTIAGSFNNNSISNNDTQSHHNLNQSPNTPANHNQDLEFNYFKKFPKICNDDTMSSIGEDHTEPMERELYSLVVDRDISESADQGIRNAICSVIFDVGSSKNLTYKIITLSDTAEHSLWDGNICEILDSDLRRNNITWDNCVSVIIDMKNSEICDDECVLPFVLEKAPSCFVASCSKYLIHNAARRGGFAFAEIAGFSLEEHLLDLCSFMKYCENESLKNELEVLVVDITECHFNTKWLFLEELCNAELKNYTAIKSLLCIKVECNDRSNDPDKEVLNNSHGQNITELKKRLKAAFEDPLTEVYLNFFVSALSLFKNFNDYLQRSDPLAHKIKPMSKELARKIGMRFLEPSVLYNVTLETLNDNSKYLPLSQVFLGLKTASKLKSLSDEEVLHEMQNTIALQAFQGFYSESLKYVLKEMDTRDEFWDHAIWIDFFNRENAMWNDVLYFVEHYSVILNFTESELEKLYEEYLDYKTIDRQELNIENATLITYDDGNVEYSMDIVWFLLQELKSPVGNNFRFKLLFKIAKIILITPHSNAGIKQVFSMVDKGICSDASEM